MTTASRPPPETFIKNQRICEKLVEREITGCASSLIYHFSQNPDSLKGSDHNWEDDILPLCVQDDWQATWDDYRQGSDLIANDEGEPTDYREACEALGLDDPHQNEAYEHWIVSKWFGSKLAEQGEMVGELFNFTIWGRCTTGQSISMDCVIESVANEMEILTGQTYQWDP